jgi:hypothetical protein
MSVAMSAPYAVDLVNTGFFFFFLLCHTLKKRLSIFPSLAGKSPTKLSLEGNNLIISVQGEFG